MNRARAGVIEAAGAIGSEVLEKNEEDSMEEKMADEDFYLNTSISLRTCNSPLLLMDLICQASFFSAKPRRLRPSWELHPGSARCCSVLLLRRVLQLRFCTILLSKLFSPGYGRLFLGSDICSSHRGLTRVVMTLALANGRPVFVRPQVPALDGSVVVLEAPGQGEIEGA